MQVPNFCRHATRTLDAENLPCYRRDELLMTQQVGEPGTEPNPAGPPVEDMSRLGPPFVTVSGAHDRELNPSAAVPYQACWQASRVTELQCGHVLLSIMASIWSTLTHGICFRVDVRWSARRGAPAVARQDKGDGEE